MTRTSDTIAATNNICRGIVRQESQVVDLLELLELLRGLRLLQDFIFTPAISTRKENTSDQVSLTMWQRHVHFTTLHSSHFPGKSLLIRFRDRSSRFIMIHLFAALMNILFLITVSLLHCTRVSLALRSAVDLECWVRCVDALLPWLAIQCNLKQSSSLCFPR